ncbi:MAG: hypothetical protein DI555_06985 [Novosphingobium pentaromativorans]|uniref:Uncharacterized protein n=1 Tax=Novosphingobium pentaromativorans TaxID=205844 RepID=A0A2W5NS33_9SPHN|nr:MAG: hypothetical protein DI555_06985 [Novosphingobium pentaromativorans]
MTDIHLIDAMLCWNNGFDGATPAFKVFRHPDRNDTSRHYRHSVGACFDYWRELDEKGRLLQLMVEVWQISAFYEVPSSLVAEGLLVIPEYRGLLARDCLPERYHGEFNPALLHERGGEHLEDRLDRLEDTGKAAGIFRTEPE